MLFVTHYQPWPCVPIQGMKGAFFPSKGWEFVQLKFGWSRAQVFLVTPQLQNGDVLGTISSKTQGKYCRTRNPLLMDHQ